MTAHPVRVWLPPSTKQQIFDTIFGVIAPILCVCFDPIIFHDRVFHGIGILESVSVFAYVTISFGVSILVIYLVGGHTVQRLSPYFAGILLFGAAASYLLGLILLPFSLFGLSMLIGIFGFIPFGTAWAFLRSGLRAAAAARTSRSGWRLLQSSLIAILMFLSIPAVLQWHTGRITTIAIAEIVSSDSATAQRAAERLHGAFWCARSCTQPLIDAYRTSSDPNRRGQIAQAYVVIMGETIERAREQASD